MTSITDATPTKTIDTIGPGTEIVHEGETYGVVSRCSEGVNVVTASGAWELIPYGTKVAPK